MQIRKSTFSKDPRSRFWVLESAMEHTCERSFCATASWKGRMRCGSRPGPGTGGRKAEGPGAMATARPAARDGVCLLRAIHRQGLTHLPFTRPSEDEQPGAEAQTCSTPRGRGSTWGSWR